MKKRQVCQMIAALVSICAVISVGSTVAAFVAAYQAGAEYPMGMALMSMVTILCTVMIWRGVRQMEK